MNGLDIRNYLLIYYCCLIFLVTDVYPYHSTKLGDYLFRKNLT